MEEQKDLFEERKDIEIPYEFSPLEESGNKKREGKATGKEDNKSPRISYSLSKNISHPAHGEQLELWPELFPVKKKAKSKVEPFHFSNIQHLTIRAFSTWISQHGDNDKIKKFKKEIEEGTAGFFSEPIPIPNSEIGKIMYGDSYRDGTEGKRVFETTQTLANKWVAQRIETYPLDEEGERSQIPHELRFSSPVIQIEGRLDDPNGESDIDISLIRFGRILMEQIDKQYIPQPLTVFDMKNENGRKIGTELSTSLLGELEQLWKNVIGAEAIEKKNSEKDNRKRISKAERDDQREKSEKALWRELKFSTIKETCSTDYSSRKMRKTFLKNLEEALFAYQNSLGIITAYEILSKEEKIRFRLNPYYGRKETTDKLIEARKQKEKELKEKKKAKKEEAPENK